MRWSRKTIALLVACLLLCATTTACKPGSKPPVKLTANDNGSKQALAVGQKLLVTLDANLTTGYQWSVDGSLPGQLKQVGSVLYSAQSNAIGGQGSDLWTFVGASAGSGMLKLKYSRSFEPTATPAKMFEVQVDVR